MMGLVADSRSEPLGWLGPAFMAAPAAVLAWHTTTAELGSWHRAGACLAVAVAAALSGWSASGQRDPRRVFTRVQLAPGRARDRAHVLGR